MAKKKARKGRPIAGKQRKDRHQVMLEPWLADLLRDLGDGNLSFGIQALSVLFIESVTLMDLMTPDAASNQLQRAMRILKAHESREMIKAKSRL